MQANVIIHPEPLVLHDFGLFRQLMNVEQFLAAAQERGVLARDENEKVAALSGRLRMGGLRLRGGVWGGGEERINQESEGRLQRNPSPAPAY